MERTTKLTLLRPQIRNYKLLMIGPVLALSLVTLIAWSSGFIAPRQSPQATFRTTGELNTSLPDARLPSDQHWNKLVYYRKADKDSAAYREAMKRDPYYRYATKSFGAAAFRKDIKGPQNASLTSVNRQVSTTEDAYFKPRYPAGLARSTFNVPDDQGVKTLRRRLAVLQESLAQQTAFSPPEPGIIDVKHDPPGIPPSPETREAEIRNRASQSFSHPATPDPEMAQLSKIMDKILAVQHPQLIADSFRRASGQQPAKAFPVRTTDPDPTGVLQVRSTEIPAHGRSTKEQSVPATRFYTLEDAFPRTPADRTLKAMVPETETLADGSMIRLALSDDLYVGDILVPAGTLLYGTIRLHAERMLVDIRSLVSEDQIMPVSLSVYDLDGLEGIHIPGAAARTSLKTSGAGAVENIGLTTLDPSWGARAADAGIRAAKSLISKKVRQVRVTVRAGYRVLLKDRSTH